MAIIPNNAIARLRAGKTAIGFGVSHLRSVAAPALAKAAGYDWLFIDMEHGAFSVHEATQLCLASLPLGIAPIVRVCTGALDEGTRALDNGAQGIVVPHVDTAAQAKQVAAAFRYPPRGTRSWGGGIAQFGFQPPPVAQAQAEVNDETLVVVMIETAEAVANVDAIAATPGIDCLLVGTSDLTADMGISGQAGHQRVQDAYRAVIDACNKHGKHAGLGGIYDNEWATFYIRMGTRFVLGGSDGMFIQQGAGARAKFLAALG
ncbi:MAG TPA: aldolase/citrate lyase family protein [Acetobacteraceae bacterium]